MGAADRALEAAAQEILERLVASGLSLRDIESETGIHRGTLSSYRAGGRIANEANYRTLARYAVTKNIFKKKS